MKALLVIFLFFFSTLLTAQENILNATVHKYLYTRVDSTTWDCAEIFKGKFIKDSLLYKQIGTISITENPNNKYWLTILYYGLTIIISHNEKIEGKNIQRISSMRMTTVLNKKTENFIVTSGEIEIDWTNGTVRLINIALQLDVSKKL